MSRPKTGSASVPMTAFDCTLRTRIVFGRGTVTRLGCLAQECGAGRAFLVTDAGIIAAGHSAALLMPFSIWTISSRTFSGDGKRGFDLRVHFS